MAEKKIKKSDVISGSLFNQTIKEVTELIKGVGLLKKELKEISKIQLKSLRGVSGSSATSSGGVQNVQKAKTQVDSITKENIRLKKLEASLTAKLISLETEEARSVAKLKEQVAQKNREQKLSIKQAKSEATSYNSLSAEYSINKTRLNAMTKAQRENTVAGRKLEKQTREIYEEMSRLQKATGKSTLDVGKYGKAWGGVKATIGRGLGLIGLTSGIYALTTVVRDAFTRVKDFDEEMFKMAGISGFARTELKSVEQAILNVAGRSVKTSNDVAKLATTLFSLGKSKDEVELLLEPITNLGIGLSATAEESANLLGSVLNAFGKGADSGQEFADVIAKIRTSTSLDFTGISESLGFLAPTANALNLTIGETGAILGVLKDNGIKASRAGRLMSSSFARLVGKGKTLSGALSEINQSTDKVATASELFGKESFSLALILANNIDKTKQLSNEFDNLSKGSLQKLVDEQLKSVTAQLGLLESAWERIVIDIANGNGRFAQLGRVINFVATNLRTILKSLVLVGVAFVSFKAGVLATNLALKIHSAITATASLRTALFSKGLKLATISFRGLNTAMKANIIGAVTSILVTIITTWVLFKDSTDDATDSLKEFNDEKDRLTKADTDISKSLDNINKLSKAQLETFKNSVNEQIALEEKLSKERILKIDEYEEAVKKAEFKPVDGINLDAQFDDADRQRLAELTKEFGAEVATKKLEQERAFSRLLFSDQVDLNKEKEAEAEAQAKIIKNQEIIEAINKRLKTFSKGANTDAEKRNELAKDYLDTVKEINEEEEGFDDSFDFIDKAKAKELEARKSLNDALNKDIDEAQKIKEDALIKEFQDGLDKTAFEKEQNQIRKENAIETIKQSATAVADIMRNINEDEIKNTERQINASKEKEDALLRSAETGNIIAQESIALERKNRAKLEQDRLKSLQKQRNIELSLSAINLLGSISRGGSENPANDTISQLTKVLSFVSSIPKNIDGTELVSGKKSSSSMKMHNGEDGYLAFFDGRERILSPDQNKELKGITNEELTFAGKSLKNGPFQQLSFNQKVVKTKDDSSVMINYALNKLDRSIGGINNAIQSMPRDNTEWSDIIDGVVKTTMKKNKLIETHYRNKGLF